MTIDDVNAKLAAAVEQLVQRKQLGTWERRLEAPERFDEFKQLVRDRGERYAGCTLQGYELHNEAKQRPVVDALVAFGKAMPEQLQAGGGLILYGPEGTGKDHLQFAMLRAAIVHHGFTATWRDGLRMQSEYFAAIKTNDTDKLLKQLATPQILAISDPLPPAGELKDWSIGFLRDVVDRRYQARKSTWLTLNVADLRRQLIDSLTAPLAARLLDKALCLHCEWPSYRKERKA